MGRFLPHRFYAVRRPWHEGLRRPLTKKVNYLNGEWSSSNLARSLKGVDASWEKDASHKKRADAASHTEDTKQPVRIAVKARLRRLSSGRASSKAGMGRNSKICLN